MTNRNFNSYPTPELEAGSYNLPPSQDGLDLDLGQYLLKLKRRWKPATLVFLATLGSAIGLSFFLQDSYSATGKLLFKQNTTASLTGVGEENNQLESLLINETPLNNELEKIEATPILQQTIEELKLTNDEGEPLKPEDFARNLNVEIVGGSDVIEIAYKSDDPQASAEVVNTLMNIYVRNQILSNQAEPANAKEFINNQLPEIESRVQQAEAELEDFRTKNSVVDLVEEKKIIVQELGIINRDIATIGANFKGKQAQTLAIQNQLGLDLKQAIAADQLGNTPVVRSTLTQLAETESALAQERQRFNDNHPSIISLNEKKTNLRTQLEGLISETVGEGVKISDGVLNKSENNNQQNVLDNFITLKIEELSLQQQLSSVAQSQQKYLDRANELPRLERQEQDLMRKLDAANNTFTALLDSRAKLDISKENATGNVDIIESAEPPEEGSSGRVPLIAFGFLSGLFLANAAAIALEWRDRSVKSIAELKKKLPYKVLGIIPEAEGSEQQGVVVRNEPDSYISELYRMLQANLKFMSSQRPPKVILVTSSVPGEGKSTITANLAAAIAQLGRHVLLIDGDLRKPTQHLLWEVRDSVGLQEVIQEQKPLASAVTQPMTKIDLLLAGGSVMNPLAVLDSPEMGELIAQGRKTYDLVLIDAPPLPVTADVLTLSKMVDGILFVSRLGVVEHESAELAQETLESIEPNILGMVINGVKAKEFDKYSYSNKYGKRYFNKKNQAKPKNNQSNGHKELEEAKNLEKFEISSRKQD